MLSSALPPIPPIPSMEGGVRTRSSPLVFLCGSRESSRRPGEQPRPTRGGSAETKSQQRGRPVVGSPAMRCEAKRSAASWNETIGFLPRPPAMQHQHQHQHQHQDLRPAFPCQDSC
jgi:hypothetical protein